ncbi:hypothetical protein DM01DRAFT_358747 [Hesseltinella vesiculosa]|uniref:Reverse transcriptase zinc-binding domain-containing protein n=1 Tax=Hesseltinella vesiculosa TaxID=101127 RepID=A0A1X2GLH8_9FUNG|nr:hypothetical protein DM01DRAFT_358747 [Hesseltinella vesiculosa]
MAYADDMVVFLNDPLGMGHSPEPVLNKTELLSLSGHPWPQWSSIRQSTGASWHDKHNPDAVKYLGFPIYCSKAQLRAFWVNCAIKIERQCQVLRGCKLSIRGTSLLCISVILASLWHALRITPITEACIRPIRSSIRKFVLPFNPAPSWTTATRPRSQGGQGVLDITSQQVALKIRLAKRIINTAPKSNDIMAMLIQGMWIRCFDQASVWDAPNAPPKRLKPPFKTWVAPPVPDAQGLLRPNDVFVPFEMLTPKLIRHCIVLSTPPKKVTGTPSWALHRPNDWRAIWSLPGSSNAVTIWWRLLHDKIPSRQRLKTIGFQLEDEHCMTCPSELESDAHLLVYCTPKKFGHAPSPVHCPKTYG